MEAKVHLFGKTKLVRIDERLSKPTKDLDYVYTSSKEVLYREGREEMYGYHHYTSRGKPFVVITREDFIRAEVID